MAEEPSPALAATVAERGPAAPAAAHADWAVRGLFVLAVLATLYVARDVVLPVVLALMLGVILTPVVRLLNRLHVPVPLAAALVLAFLFTLLLTAGYQLAQPANVWLAKTPEAVRVVGLKLRHVMGQVKVVARATEQVQDVTADMARGALDSPPVPEVSLRDPTLAGNILVSSRSFLLSLSSVVVLLFFMLASGDLFLRKIIAVTPRFADKKRAVDIMRQIESEVSTYLFTVATINVALGSAVALALYTLDVPNPMLWGVMVGVFNFVPYFGDIASTVVLAVVGLLSFDNLWQSLQVPMVFFVLTALEGYLVTPLVLGRRLSLNPVVIVLSVLLWSWMWGLPGALLAVPMLVVVKTFCDRVEPLAAFGEFLAA